VLGAGPTLPALLQPGAQEKQILTWARRSRKLAVRALGLERAQVYADELTRRETISEDEQMEALTKDLNRFTWWIVSLTA
jgi:hypothetical protein